MTAKLFLSAGLLLFIGYLVTNPHVSRVVRLGLSMVPLTGIALVWSPETANRVAAAVGIGRGADLMLYCWVVASLMVGLVLHVRIRVLHQELTELTRHVAISEATRGGESTTAPPGEPKTKPQPGR
jgi:hypothetical protein